MAERQTLDVVVRDPERGGSLCLNSVSSELGYVDLRGSANVLDAPESIDVELRIEADEPDSEMAFDLTGSDWRFFDVVQGDEVSARLAEHYAEQLPDGPYKLDRGVVEFEGRRIDGFSISDPFPIIAVAAILVGGVVVSKLIDAGTAAYFQSRSGRKPIIKSKWKLSIGSHGASVEHGSEIKFED
jgi:hypothetical protein